MLVRIARLASSATCCLSSVVTAAATIAPYTLHRLHTLAQALRLMALRLKARRFPSGSAIHLITDFFPRGAAQNHALLLRCLLSNPQLSWLASQRTLLRQRSGVLLQRPQRPQCQLLRLHPRLRCLVKSR